MKIATLTQKFFSLRLVLIIGIALAFGACKNNDPQPEDGFSEEIRSNVPDEMMDAVREMGVRINEGTKPPVLEGTYWLAPLVMTKTDVPGDNAEIGYQFLDYKIKLYDQDSKKLTISLDSKGYDSYGDVQSTAIGQDGAYISGSGNFFTIFVITHGSNTYNSSKYKVLEVYSGEMTSGGIKNVQNAVLMMDNYDNINNDLIPNNTGRAFKDGDGFSETAGTFRLASNREHSTTENTMVGAREVLIKK